MLLHIFSVLVFKYNTQGCFWTLSSRMTSCFVFLVPQFRTASSTRGCICLQKVSCNSCLSAVNLANHLKSHILPHALGTMCFVFLYVFNSAVNSVPKSFVSLKYFRCSPLGVATIGLKSVSVAEFKSLILVLELLTLI